MMSRTLIYSHVPLWPVHHAEALELCFERASAEEIIYFFHAMGLFIHVQLIQRIIQVNAKRV